MEKTHITEEELVERYNAVLDLNAVNIKVMYQTLSIPASRVVKLADPVAYRTGLADFADYLDKSEGITAEGYVS
jgi:hypothetical protein